MSTYRKARFGLAGGYEMPKVEFTEKEIAEIIKAVLPMPKASQDVWRSLGTDFLQDIARWYFVVASQSNDAPTKRQLKEYAEDLNKALERLYMALGADRKYGMVARTSLFAAGKPYVANVSFHPKWEAYEELLALGALPEMRNGADWFHATANLAPEVIADIMAKGQLHLFGSQSLLDDQHTLARALAGVDALAAIARSGLAAVDSLPESQGGRPSAQQEQAFLFSRLAVLFRKTYGEEPKSTKSGEEFKGTWHDWLDALLPRISAKLEILSLKKHQVPGETWSREAAYEWLKKAQELEKTYKEWLEKAQESEKNLTES
jgi:hypothetical protein